MRSFVKYFLSSNNKKTAFCWKEKEKENRGCWISIWKRFCASLWIYFPFPILLSSASSVWQLFRHLSLFSFLISVLCGLYIRSCGLSRSEAKDNDYFQDSIYHRSKTRTITTSSLLVPLSVKIPSISLSIPSLRLNSLK